MTGMLWEKMGVGEITVVFVNECSKKEGVTGRSNKRRLGAVKISMKTSGVLEDIQRNRVK